MEALNILQYDNLFIANEYRVIEVFKQKGIDVSGLNYLLNVSEVMAINLLTSLQ